MADANTTRYGLVKPEISASADSWGSKLNQDYDDIDVLLGAITTTGSANAYVLTTGLSLAAYVSGQSFLIKANFTNSGAATINVDTLGAKSLVKGASTALASGDITSGAIYHIAYDSTNFVVLNAGAGSYQPLDATLTALAALSWSSGNALTQFTAADTVSLTLTPSVTTLTTASTTSTTHGVTAKNVADAGAVVALRIEGDRATPTANDSVAASFYLSDSAGNQDEFAQIRVNATDITSTSEDAELYFRLMVAGSLTTKFVAASTTFAPSTSDGASLGTATNMWSDAFLASGGVLNWNNGDVTVTHSSNALAFAGASSGYSFDAPVSSSSAAATTPAATFTNNTNAASVMALRLDGDRSAPGTFDLVYQSFFLSDSAGNQDEFGRISVQSFDSTSTSEDGALIFGIVVAGTVANKVQIANSTLGPTINDGLPLGTTALGWSDLHLATGGVLNWANGLVTLTHDATSDGLEVAGGSFRARIALSTETSGTLTSASANKRVKATAGVTINDGVFTAEDSVEIYNDSDVSITITQDTGMTLRLAGSTSTGNRTLAARGIAYVYFDTNSDAAVAGSGVS
jgi:hypothetical protein